MLDFETTGWDRTRRVGKFLSPPEIIEISAVLVNGISGRLIDHFQQYVLPTDFPILSEKCIKKTGKTCGKPERITFHQLVVPSLCKQWLRYEIGLKGIRQIYLDEVGVPLPAAFSRFNKWIKDMLYVHQFVMVPDQPDPESNAPMGVFVTWTDWPLETCLVKECHRKGLVKPMMFNFWIDLKLTYRRAYPREKPCTLKNCMFLRDIPYLDPKKTLLGTGVSGAKLIHYMIENGIVFNITGSFKEKNVVMNTSLPVEMKVPEEGQGPAVPESPALLKKKTEM